MQIDFIKKYRDFFRETKNEPVVIIQGSKRSGKTFSILQHEGLKFFGNNNIKIQCFSDSPKQQNFGLMSDFQNIFNPVLSKTKRNATQKLFKYQHNELAFINVAGNVRADDIVNSLGACNDRYVNECNTWNKSAIEKLMINNTGQMYFDFNPYRDFWISELITDKNFLKTTWRDNPFLSLSQIKLFLQWTEEGQKAEFGSYKYWRWQVMCEGNFCEMLGKVFTPENMHFCSKVPDSVNLHSYIIFADPSDAKGGDYFALTLTALGDDGNVYLLDSFSSNMIGKVMIAEKIKEWQRYYPVAYTYIETNGAYGTKFYNDCITSQMEVSGWYSRKDKFERIMSNFDVITDKLYIVENENNSNFLQQIYTFDEYCEHDDNIDCLNNALMAYILVFGELKVLF